MQSEKTLLILRAGEAAPTTAAAEVAAAKRAKELGFRVLLAMGGTDGLLNECLFEFDGTVASGADFRPGGLLGTTLSDVLFEYGQAEWERIHLLLSSHGVTDILVEGDRSAAALSLRLAETHPALRVAYLPLDVTGSVSGTHHSLGYGSGAKRIAADAVEIASAVSSVYGENPGGVYEIPETESGWLALSAALGRADGVCAADLQFIPEIPFDLGKMVMDTIFCLHDTGKCLIVFSHGLRWKNGDPIFRDESMSEDRYGRGYDEDMNSYIAGHIKAVSSRTFSLRADVTAGGFTRVLSAFDKEETERAARFAVEGLMAGGGSFGVSLPEVGGDIKTAPLCDFTALKKVPEAFYDKDAQRASEAFLEYAAPLILGECCPPMEGGLPVYGGLGLSPAEKLLPAVEKKTGFVLADRYERKPKKR